MAKEYIERALLLKLFCGRCNEEMSDEPCEPLDCFAWQVIMNAPAADVVEVCRCKNCRLSKRSCFGEEWRYCRNNGSHHKKEHFCSYGETGEG